MKRAEIHTKKGVMKIKFFEEDAPNTVKNFISLAEKGFYDGLIFHRVIPNFHDTGRMSQWYWKWRTRIQDQLRINRRKPIP